MKYDIPSLKLTAGTLVRQLNPFAGYNALDQLMCITEEDYNRRAQPWIFVPAEIEALSSWQEERQRMIDNITQSPG